MPRAAHHRHDGATNQRGPDRGAHVGLANGLGRRCRPLGAADGGHRRGDRRERGSAVPAVFDDILPPALGVRLAGRRGEGGNRVEDGAVG